MMKSESESYKAAGVDITAGYASVELMKKHVARTMTAGCVEGIGGFGGLFALDAAGMEEPVLVSGTDGVGTKLKIAMLLDKHDTIGIDCVAMCVNDVICCGAKPLFFLDYIACGKNVPEKIASFTFFLIPMHKLIVKMATIRIINIKNPAIPEKSFERSIKSPLFTQFFKISTYFILRLVKNRCHIRDKSIIRSFCNLFIFSIQLLQTECLDPEHNQDHPENSKNNAHNQSRNFHIRCICRIREPFFHTDCCNQKKKCSSGNPHN